MDRPTPFRERVSPYPGNIGQKKTINYLFIVQRRLEVVDRLAARERSGGLR